jgi:hypothetical protein
LRPDAITAIAMVTDEADGALATEAVMFDNMFREIDPDSDEPGESSAIIWNAGVDCTENGDGTYDCTSHDVETDPDNNRLQPLARYTNYLINKLRETDNKEVVMLGILGVPPVERDADGNITGGGVDDLIYRDWLDSEYPAGDILPEEWADGVRAADKQFNFGIGPGCTGEDPDNPGTFTGQAIPPVRIKEVCQALDIGDERRCCIESVCDDDFSGAIDCLADTIGDAIELPG